MRPDRRLQVRHHQRGGQALSADIGDAHGYRGLVQFQYIEIVSTDGIGRTPERRNAKTGNLRDLRRHKSFLNVPRFFEFSLVRTFRPDLRSAKNRTHASKEFPYRERLRDVIIGAGVKAANSAALAVVSCEHQDGRRKRKAADVTTYVVTVHSGKHQIENYEIRLLLAHKAITGLAVGGSQNVVGFQA